MAYPKAKAIAGVLITVAITLVVAVQVMHLAHISPNPSQVKNLCGGVSGCGGPAWNWEPLVVMLVLIPALAYATRHLPGWVRPQ